MDRTLIVFDMDTNCLKLNYHNPSWQNAYGDVSKVLKKHGFSNIQGTVYLSEEGIRQAHGTLALQEVAARFEWFYSCASNVQFYELKDDFNARLQKSLGFCAPCSAPSRSLVDLGRFRFRFGSSRALPPGRSS